MARTPTLARRLFDRLEPVHAVTYFAPESREALDGLGFRGFWMGYFAARSAPLGVVPPQLVTAMFYNFDPGRVAKALPAAWDVTTPARTLETRTRSAVAALRRYGITDDDPDTRAASELLATAAQHAAIDGRPLFAANLSLDWPDEPVAGLWHAATLLREQRGDGHVALLAAAGISGRECNVLHAAAGRVPREMIMRARDYDDEQWNLHASRLADRGLLHGDGSLTDAGCDLKEHLEDRTDALALPAFDVLDDAQVTSLFRAATSLTRKVVAAGDVPAGTPMGLSRDDLDDDEAHLD